MGFVVHKSGFIFWMKKLTQISTTNLKLSKFGQKTVNRKNEAGSFFRQSIFRHSFFRHTKLDMVIFSTAFYLTQSFFRHNKVRHGHSFDMVIF